MRVVITGGGGFLGSLLCNALIQRGTLTGPSGQLEPIDRIILVDRHFREPATGQSTPKIVTQKACDISDRDAVFDAIESSNEVSIFHLASMVSGECEERFDDAIRINLVGGLNIFEAARSVAKKSSSPLRPRVVFASSIACFGGDTIPDHFSDDSKLLPGTTYGMTKAVCELLINDCSRKRFFDGRSARLPTVIIRPGKPNAAASSWASGMFREPLNGEDCLLPVHREQRHPMTGYKTVIDSLIFIHEIPEAQLGRDRGIGLPAHQVTPNMAEQVLREIAQSHGRKIGKFTDAFDSRIQGIVNGWPTAIHSRRAEKLGLPMPPPLKTIVEQYIQDFL